MWHFRANGIVPLPASLRGDSVDPERHRRRQAESLPILADIRTVCIDAQPRYNSGSTMRKALNYLLDHSADFTAHTRTTSLQEGFDQLPAVDGSGRPRAASTVGADSGPAC